MYSLIFLAILLLTQHLIVCQKSTENSMKSQICKEKDLSIDSAFRPLETDFVYLFYKDLFCKLKIISEDQSEIESANQLSFWSKEIKAPIDLVTADEFEIQYISLINTAVQIQWNIRYEDDHYNGSRSSSGWQKIFENLMTKKAGEKLYRSYLLANTSNNLEIEARVGGLHKYLRLELKSNADNESMSVKIVDEFDDFELQMTKPFTNLNGHWISAGFIHSENWYLFGGKYYCRLKLNDLTYEECKPNMITDWIQDCSENQSSDQKNKDISVFVIILFSITALGIVCVVVIGLLIYREYSSQKTSTLSSQ